MKREEFSSLELQAFMNFLFLKKDMPKEIPCVYDVNIRCQAFVVLDCEAVKCQLPLKRF